jgi:magnesium-transporting ATPase (P-type)
MNAHANAMTDPGLTSAEAARRLVQYGPNEPAPVRRLSAVVQLVHLFGNPLVIILLVASAISASLSEKIDALIIVTIVLLSVSVNFWQASRSQKAVERLRASVTPTATVLRDGLGGDLITTSCPWGCDPSDGRRRRSR